jgi:hypothetical protein
MDDVANELQRLSWRGSLAGGLASDQAPVVASSCGRGAELPPCEA